MAKSTTIIDVPLTGYGLFQYNGAFEPNGTLSPGEWNYYSIDTRDLKYNKYMPLVAMMEMLTNNSLMELYLEDSSLPTSSDYVSYQLVNCSLLGNYSYWGGNCSNDQPNTKTVGKCNAKKALWYLGVHNAGTVPLTYRLAVGIDAKAQLFNAEVSPFGDGCGAYSDELWRSVIYFILVIVFPIVGVLCCIIACCVAAFHHYFKQQRSKSAVNIQTEQTRLVTPYSPTPYPNSVYTPTLTVNAV